MFDYQERALESGKKLHIIQAGRRLGKTTLCIKALGLGFNRRIVFLTKSAASIKTIVDQIREAYPDYISSYSHNMGIISLRNGNTIRLYNSFKDENTFCGVRADTLIVDDADWYHSNILPSLSAILNNEKAIRVFIVGGYTERDTIMKSYVDRYNDLQLSDVYTEEFNWMDAVKEDNPALKAYYELVQEEETEKAFRHNHGPWNNLGFEHRTNRELIKLLIPN